jgi:hypothetical protein
MAAELQGPFAHQTSLPYSDFTLEVLMNKIKLLESGAVVAQGS